MSAGRFTTRWGRRGSSATEAALISRLRDLPGPAPEARFRSELRAQLVAITARIVSESEPASAGSGRSAPAGALLDSWPRTASGRVLRRLRRPILALAGASTVLVLLLGMAVWMAGGALPGQSLYGVKRASEDIQLSIAGNDTAKGQAYLQLAGNRVREVADLLSQPSAMLATGGVSADGRRISPRTAALITDTLASADDDSINGMQLLGRAAVAQLSAAPLSKLSDWLPDQRSRMTAVRDRVPAGAVRTRVQASLLLLQRIAARTTQLIRSMGCPCLAQALADELGPVPCVNCSAVPNPPPGGGPILPVPIPGTGSPGTSGSLPSLSLPPLGGSGRSSSGHAAGPAASWRTVPALPAVLPSGAPTRLPSLDPASSGAPSTSPRVLKLPSLPAPGVLGASVPVHLPSTLPVQVPLPGATSR